ncbi:MAG: Death-on-curing family protein [Candidatus Gottesmanbacteria bacterium GW2011_GWA1_34_13]|uniref:Death-on-curing family protein n=1 Tax=Candidatus Gottesmanbacteria bacterium GW2011_GWA1_34_13 TaxID=1618434 RepID=A0A0G0AQQ6_9BACT|nr:MAG: Death-on-curing family protein [Candidatus Gottesmanbacteria bacterium GW2011_GWA1_34_13]
MGEPIPPIENRFPGKLESILASVRQTFDGKSLNATVLDAASAYFNQIIRGHPFQNGNKRLAVMYTHIFLLWHGLDLSLYYNEMFYFALTVAKAGEEGINSEKTRNWCKTIIGQFAQEKK